MTGSLAHKNKLVPLPLDLPLLTLSPFDSQLTEHVNLFNSLSPFEADFVAKEWLELITISEAWICFSKPSHEIPTWS